MKKWVADRAALLLLSVVVAASAWFGYRYAGDWFIPVSVTVVLIALGAEVGRLRRILREHGIDASRRKRN
ncbi:hypothetical protein FAZ95_08450 [Trinickia violacea]|uniref:Uncharacterized protein n=1 Tax=Trinickia violacea TaxID=2571746 RepID=A0A4P8INS8_9BURK|nr:hypothetical protein [Trinickia violacea]QCP49205.1 hypothetical protein FAZ95_08450 [Trinickia violacea]